jgi:flagellar assembly protein FliH
MIKAYSVRYEDEAKKTIDTHLRIDKELEMKRTIAIQQTLQPGLIQEGFVEGLKAVMVEALPDPEETKEKASKITEDAKAEAKRILDQAKKEAEQLKKDSYSTAQKKGYEDGMAGARKEAERLKADYEDQARRLQEEYEAMAEHMEPQMAQIIAALVEKITGIVVAGKEEVILFLIDRAIKNMDKSDEYTIRVSKDDYEYVSMRKNLLLGAIGREVPLYITEDPYLNKNQCLIETEQKVINCSLDIQLINLITDLKLIGGI